MSSNAVHLVPVRPEGHRAMCRVMAADLLMCRS